MVLWLLKLIKSQVVRYVSWLKINISGTIYVPIIRADVITGSRLSHPYSSNLLYVFKTEYKPVGAKGHGSYPQFDVFQYFSY
jgi:hypothetical protein